MTSDLWGKGALEGASVTRESVAMLDPSWTPAKGYSHANRLMEIVNAQSQAKMVLDMQATLGTIRDLTDHIGRGTHNV